MGFGYLGRDVLGLAIILIIVLRLLHDLYYCHLSQNMIYSETTAQHSPNPYPLAPQHSQPQSNTYLNIKSPQKIPNIKYRT